MKLNSILLFSIIWIGSNYQNNDKSIPAHSSLKSNGEFKEKSECDRILEKIKAYVLGSRNDTVKKEVLKNGLTLKLSDTSYKVLSFDVAITGVHYYVVKSNGPKLTPPEIKDILIPKPKMLFIDDIKVMKKDTCYNLKSSFVCKVID